MKKIILLATVIFLSTSSHLMAQRVIAFYAGWENAASSIQWDKVTDANYAFLVPSSVADGSLETWSNYQQQLFKDFITATASSGIRRHISIGGADGSGTGQAYSSYFRTIANNATKRQTFATNIANWVNGGNPAGVVLDGVDIDWEWPGSSDGAAFTNLMSAVRTALDNINPAFELSADVFPSIWNNEGIKTDVYQYVDHFNIMCYDYDNQANHSTYQEAVNSVNYWTTTRSLSADKICLGLPFYGRLQGPNQLGSQEKYKVITASNAATASQTDVYNGWYYNGQPTIKSKTELAINEGLKGVMIWEVSQDRTDQYSLLDAIDEVINDPSTCIKPDFARTDTSICGLSSISLSSGISTTGYTYEWKKDGEVISSASSTSYSATTGGKYEVYATKTANGCTKSDVITVIDEFEEIDMGGIIAVCGSSDATLDAGISGSGISYSWSPGNETTQTITTSTIGTYTVTLSDDNSKCPNKSGTVEVSSASLDLSGDETCGPSGEVTLKVNTGGGPFSWFDAETDGSLLEVGNEYTTTISSNSTFWVQNTGGSVSYTVGRPASNFGDANFTGYNSYQSTNLKYQLEFDALQELTIDSVTIWGDWSTNTASVVLTVLESDGSTQVGTTTFQYTADGGGGVSFRVPVGITVPAGTGYLLDFDETDVAIGWEEDSEALPWSTYGESGVISFNTSIDPQWGDDGRRWISAYDWKVSTGEPCPRESVQATILSCSAPVVSITSPTNNSSVEKNETVSLQASATDADGTIASVTYTITKGATTVSTQSGNGTTSSWNAAWTPTEEGNYTITATATDDNGNSTTSSSIDISVTGAITAIEGNISETISISPNPSTNVFNIELNGTFHYQLFTVSGQLVTEGDATQQVAFGENLSVGAYYLQISDNQQVYTTKIIKQ